MRLEAANIEAFALGCAIMSAGGGGDPAIGLVMARHAIDESGPVDVVDAESIDPSALIMPCGLIGSPTLAQERVWNGHEGVQLAAAVERLAGSPVVAIMCYEIAGVNGLMPVVWAARMGRPLLDGDGMGRAFPEMQQQAMHVAGISASPAVLTDGRGNVIVIEAVDNLTAERLARSSAATFGGTCAGALYTMTARRAAESIIRGSVSTAVRIGAAMGSRRSGWPDALAEETAGRVLIEGRVVEVERRTGAGFTRGYATIDGAGRYAGRRLRLELQNEVLVALEDGEVLATVPDIITVLAGTDGRPVGTERLHHGQRVGVVAIPGPDVWRTEAGLRVVSPRSFGYSVDYVRGATDVAH